MAYKVPGASLQDYNSQLVETLQGLKDERESLHRKIESAQSEQHMLEHRALHLTEQLVHVNQNMSQKHEIRSEYNRVVQETEAAYLQVLESSEFLLHKFK